uniref:Anti-sigma factor antagonist n=1 Tax=Schlesneria paludicola TaxID=360056 RepID=A0A7C2JZX8_9PLAN
MSDAPFLNVVTEGDVTVAEFGPRCKLIEEPILEALGRELATVTAAADPPLVLLDLTQTTFFGSGFLETLFRVWKGMQSKPRPQLCLCGLHPYCREVLEITHLDKMWPLYASRAEALAALASRPD